MSVGRSRPETESDGVRQKGSRGAHHRPWLPLAASVVASRAGTTRRVRQAIPRWAEIRQKQQRSVSWRKRFNVNIPSSNANNLHSASPERQMPPVKSQGRGQYAGHLPLSPELRPALANPQRRVFSDCPNPEMTARRRIRQHIVRGRNSPDRRSAGYSRQPAGASRREPFPVEVPT